MPAPFGVAVALVGHHLQLDLAGGGKGDPESEKNTLPATSSIRKNKLSAKLMINLLLQPP